MPSETRCHTAAFRRGLMMDPDESFPEWCDQHIVLPQGRHAESGPWRTARTPPLKEIMEELSPRSATPEVVVMKGAQLGLTQTGVHWCGYVMLRAPGPILFVEPTTDVAKKLSKQRFQPMLEDGPLFAGVVKPSRSRDSGNTILMKEFIGGDLVITGANSGVGLRFMTARYLVLDEEDGYPADVDGEGPPSELAKNRLSTFSRSKTFRMSTPLDATTSVIEPAYLAGSRAHYYVPCPFCFKTQWLQWSGVTFTFDGKKDFERTAYACEHCHALIPEHHKTFMLEMGGWVHEDPDNPIRSYHLSTLYAPYGWTKVSWKALAREFVAADKKSKNGDMRYLKKFNNTKLAETWQDQGEKVEASGLERRAEVYPADCPEGVLVLTAAVDVQDTWLEALIVGWGIEEESWQIARERFDGSPANLHIWKALSKWIQERRTHASGIALRVECVTVDTGGHHNKEAHAFVKGYRGGRIYAIHGSSILGSPLVPVRPGKSRKGRGTVYAIGTVAAKDTLFERFKIDTPGPGYIHYPKHKNFDSVYFAQLASEEKTQKFKKGVQVGHFYRQTGGRNEALDLTVYNMAAFAFLNPDLEAIAAQWTRRVQQVMTQPETTMPAIGTPGRRRIISRGVE